jgi:hypothetical protein
VLPAFIRFGVQIDRQLRRTPGAVGYRTGIDFARFGFYHLSAWKDLGAIQEFVATAPHLTAVEQLGARLGTTTFRYWSVSGSYLPLQFGRELHRLGNRT